MKIYLGFIILIMYAALIYKVVIQQEQIIELQKNHKQFTVSQTYIALKTGVESGEQFPVIGGEWYRCAKVITE